MLRYSQYGLYSQGVYNCFVVFCVYSAGVGSRALYMLGKLGKHSTTKLHPIPRILLVMIQFYSTKSPSPQTEG